MYRELDRIKKSGTPDKYWKPHYEAIKQLEAKLDELP